MILGDADPMATGFVGSRTIVRIHSVRTQKKSGQTSEEDRYYLSSQESRERTPEEWINLSRSHWAGVENRNHWRRDATLGEDRSRLGNARALTNLALLRSVNLRLINAWSSTRRNIRGSGLPGCSSRVTPPSSEKPKPIASHAGTAEANLSMPAASPTGLGNLRPNNSTGSSSDEKKEALASVKIWRFEQNSSPPIVVLWMDSQSCENRNGLMKLRYSPVMKNNVASEPDQSRDEHFG